VVKVNSSAPRHQWDKAVWAVYHPSLPATNLFLRMTFGRVCLLSLRVVRQENATELRRIQLQLADNKKFCNTGLALAHEPGV